MNRKDRVGDDGCDREKVKEISEEFPHKGIAKFVLALHIKAIVLGDGSELMVASDEEHLGGILQFQQAEKRDCFDAVCSSIYVVAQEQIIGIGQFSPNFKDLQDVIELSVNVADHCDWQ